MPLEYRDKATRQPSYKRISSEVSLSDLFFPEHLRLGPHNWLEFKHAIEIVLRVQGIPLWHLTSTDMPFQLRANGGEDGDEALWKARLRDRWVADNELCKAFILLNVRSDHVRLLLRCEHEHCSAAEIWQVLMKRDVEIQSQVEKKWARLESTAFVVLPWLVLVLLLMCVVAL